jgi:hypothetical protein
MERQIFTPEPSIGYRWVPGLRTRVEHEGGGYLVRTNETGFRSEREFAPTKPDGKFRILLFGDSFTAGDGVSNPKRYSDQLEQLLPDVEVFNLALSGSGTDQQLLLFRQFAPALEHDLVVVGVMVENIRRIVARYRIARAPDGVERAYPKPYFTLDADELLLHGVPVASEPRELDSFDGAERAHLDLGGDFVGIRQAISRLGSGVKELALRVSRYQPLPAYSSTDNPGWRLMRRILEAWASESAAPVLVMPIPLYHYIEDIAEPTYVERFEELHGYPNITLHDPLPYLRARPQAERRQLRFRTDEHPTALAHRLLAESLATAVSPLL